MNGFDPIQNRKQRAAERATTQPLQPQEPVVQKEQPTSLAAGIYKPFYESGILTADEEARKKRSFGQVVGEDVLNLALAPAALVGIAADTLINPEKTPETLYNVGKGFVQGFIEPFKGQVWKDRPVSNLVNVIGDISIIGGLAKSFAMNGAKTASINAAKNAAVKAGADPAMIETAFNKSSLFGKYRTSNKALTNAMSESVKLNSATPFENVLNMTLKKAGLDDATALNISKEVATNYISTWLTENISRMSKLDKVINPLSIFGKDSLVSKKIQTQIFGGTEKSAVGKLYGSELVKQDIKGFGLTEEWASNQVFERGWKDTVENRVRVIQDWLEDNPEYSSLTPLERNKHLANYAEIDLKRKNFAIQNGGNYILTRKLPSHYSESMIDYIKTLPDDLTNSQVAEKLLEQYGKDFGTHLDEIKNRLGNDFNTFERAKLTEAIGNLSKARIPISVEKLTPSEAQFLKEMEGTGYRFGAAPRNKIVSQSSELTGAFQNKEYLIAGRSAIGKFLDKLGLSPEGTVEGFQMFKFRENFNQLLFDRFKDRTITINGAKIPVESMSSYLEKLRKIYMNEDMTLRKYLSSKFTIADLRKDDLVKMGFSEKDATILDDIIRNSVTTSPSVVGLGEALSNFLRTRNNTFARAYDNFMRWQSTGRFKINPMFGLQSAMETISWGSLWAKKYAGTTPTFVNKGMNLIRKGLKKPIIEANSVPTIQEETLVLNEVMGDYMRQLRDSGSPSEMFRGAMDENINLGVNKNVVGVERLKQNLRFKNKTQDSNVFLGLAGFSNVKVGTNMMKAYAKRFGMTLEEALDYKIVDGKKVYTNDWMVRNMKEAAQAIFGYQPGILTSPLIRTLNTVFFPVRFQTKTMIQTAKWLGELHPVQRAMVINEWTNMAAWLTTDEGKKWKNGNRGLFANLFNYTFAFEGIGQSLDAVTRGKLFSGNTGKIGGLPFGFLFDIARDLGYTKTEKEISQATGKEFKRKIVKKSTSFAGFVTAVEDVLLSMTPSMPFSQATGGIITPSLRSGAKQTIEEILSAIYAGAKSTLGGDEFKKEFKDIKRDINRQRVQVKTSYSKLSPKSITED